MAAHRYWRLLHQPQQWIGYHEIELRANGVDQTGSGVATASSEYDSRYTPVKAVDNDNTTWWSTAQWPGVSWWQYDFGAGNDKDIDEIAFWADNGVRIPASFQVQWSDDGTNWTTWATGGVASPAANEWYYIRESGMYVPPPAGIDGQWHRPPRAFRYWRVWSERSDHGSYTGIGRLELRTIDGTNVALNKPATASGVAAGYSASAPFSSTPGSGWLVQKQYKTWLQVDLGQPYEIATAVMKVSTYTWNSSPSWGVIYGSNDPDADDWHPEFYFTAAAYMATYGPHWTKDTKTFYNASYLLPAPARYWRILVDAGTSSTATVTGLEIELREIEGGADATSPTTGVAWASSSSLNNPIMRLFDNNTSGGSWWDAFGSPTAGESPLPQYVAYDFGAGNDKYIREFTWRNYNTPNVPMGGRLQFSHDSESWADHYWFRVDDAWTPSVPKAFAYHTLPETPLTRTTLTFGEVLWSKGVPRATHAFGEVLWSRGEPRTSEFFVEVLESVKRGGGGLRKRAASLAWQTLVELIEVDLRPLGSTFQQAPDAPPGIIRISPNWTGEELSEIGGLGTPIWFQGQRFWPSPAQAEGFTWSTDDPIARPKLSIGDRDGLIYSEILQFDDLVGSTVLFWQTDVDFLDFIPGTDTPAIPGNGDCHGPEIYIIDKLVMADGFVVQWELASDLDQDVEIPRRKAWRKDRFFPMPAIARTRV